MQFTREVNRLLFGLMLLFGVVAAAAAYWSVVGPDTIWRREDNPRLVLIEAGIMRGDIIDREGELLVNSVPGEETSQVTRLYLYPEMYSALGYFSLRYGVGGAESAYNITLRGDEQNPSFGETLADIALHRPQEGTDIQVTFDLDIQQVLAEAMEGQTGAAVVLSVPEGEVLGMVSNPTYNPNTLDHDWNTLSTAPGNPFFNRALQGRYQPGGALQTPLMAAAILSNIAWDTPIEDATQPFEIEDLTLGCAVRLPDIDLTLRDAYAFACPAPFAQLGENLGAQSTQAALQTFKLYDQHTLPGFVPEQPPPTPQPFLIPTEELLKNAVGQGQLTVSPFTMAMVTAAIVNDGNTPQPFTLLATRPAGATEWQPAEAIRPTIPLATTRTARQLQDLMRYTVANGAAQNAGRPNIDIGGHASVAYSGEGPQAWFIGFVTLPGRRGATIAIVLENSDDPGLAADIGGRVLAAAHAELITE